MRVLITGGAGLLGTALIAAPPPNVDVAATLHERPLARGAVERVETHRVDLADPTAVSAVFEEANPDLIIHTAYRRLDGERHIVDATANVVAATSQVGATLVHLSSDVVFDGEHAPYGESSSTQPVNEYGRHKLAAERTVLDGLPGAAVVRTSLIVGFDPPDPVTAWVVEGARRGDDITLFEDEWRCPILVEDLATAIWEIVSLPSAERGGVWHVVGPEAMTRMDLGRRLGERFGLDAARLVAVPSPRTEPGADGRPRDLRLTDDRARTVLRCRPREVR